MKFLRKKPVPPPLSLEEQFAEDLPAVEARLMLSLPDKDDKRSLWIVCEGKPILRYSERV